MVARGARRRTGLVAGVLRGGGRWVRGGGGRAGGAPPDGRSLLEVGSLTKTYTSLLLADGVVRGDWRLDTPVRELLPAGTVVPSRGGVEITLEHLATHRSGLPRVPLPTVRGSWQMLRNRDPYAPLTTELLLEQLAATRLRRTPGTGGVGYSNTGVGLLGLALAHACGTSYGELLARRVTAPLGLHDTTTPDLLHAEQRARVRPGHRRSGRPAPSWPMTAIPAAGALLSTAEDVLSWLAVQLDPHEGPLSEAVALTQVPRVRGRRGGTGLGWMRLEGPHAAWWHNGGTGGYRCFATFVPEHRTAVVVLSSDARSVDLLGLWALRRLTGR
nr:serine hydrolase domain-containing protein [Nocardioides perillae]